MAASVEEVTKPETKKIASKLQPRSSSPPNFSQMPIELADWQPATPIGFREKFKKKAVENPFVPVGILATTCALAFGLISFNSGNVQRSQMMMRARVAAQAFTIGAVLVGVALQARKSTKPKDT